MKRVLLLGDSISMGYREIVKDELKSEAEIFYCEENGRYTKYTYWLANQWIRTYGAPDMIHFNNGIWDICSEAPIDGNFTPITEYLMNLECMVKLFRRAGVSSIIFATTTYPKPHKVELNSLDVERYNCLAVALMYGLHIPVNDLGKLVLDHLEEYVCEDKVHLTEAGYQAAAAMVAKKIRAALHTLE